MYYYEVAIGTDKTWKSQSYTYSSDSSLADGSLVAVPFGAKSRIGVVTQQTSKPDFATKQITSIVAEEKISKQTEDFFTWYEQYYALQNGQSIAQMVPSYLSIPKKKASTTTKKQKSLPEDTQLNNDQLEAVKQLTSTTKPSVLHGITGSGKTRVYVQLIKKQCKKGKSSLLLLPEISLTPQIATELGKYVDVVVFHSNLTNTQRSRIWLTVLQSKTPIVIVGTRSALFLPYTDLGLVIIDEAHEPSYKQDTDTRYNSLMVAGGLAQSHKAKLITASATPPIRETELIQKAGGNLVCMHTKAVESSKTTDTHVVNKKDTTQFTQHYLLSNALIASINNSLQKNEQSLLFINRRGTAKLMFCDNCDWHAECPDCELPTTYHHDMYKMLCHTCGRSFTAASACPVCAHAVRLRSLGSKAIVQEVQKLFPGAKIARFDSDNKKSESFSALYDSIVSGGVDIIIGTQQLAKGLDLPLLSTVGVLDADLSLNFPDYTSEERTFQLISQVAGRIGRGHTNGTTIIQTYQPNNPIIQQAMSESWHNFRQRELDIRKKHSLPPYIHTAKIIFRNKSYDIALKQANHTKESLEKLPLKSLDGPIASYFAKRGGYYYIQLHLKSTSRKTLLEAVRQRPAEALYDLDPATLL